MKKTPILRLVRLALPTLAGLILIADGTGFAGPRTVYIGLVQSSCSDSPKDCKLPVRSLGEKGGCACFACEYGKKTQRTVCTDDKANRAALMAKVRSSPKKPAPKK